MPAPNMLEDTIRVHDAAVYDWIGGLLVDYPSDPGGAWDQRKAYPILRAIASPDRAFAELSNRLVAEGFFKDEASAAAMRSKASGIDALPLPAVTIQSIGGSMDTSLSRPGEVIRRMTVDPVTGAYIPHPFPVHQFTEYTLTFWCRKNYTANFISEWLLGKTGARGLGQNEVLIAVKHVAPWGTMRQAATVDGPQDRSDLEGADSPRYKRFDVTLRLRTWVMKSPLAPVFPTEQINSSTAIVGGTTTAEESMEQANLFGIRLSDEDVRRLWPTTGDATVYRSIVPTPPEYAGPGLRIVVSANPDDSVVLAERSANPASGYEIWSAYGAWTAYGGALELQGYQRAGVLPDESLRINYADRLVPTVSWKRFHRFFLFDDADPLAGVRIAGTGEPALAHVRNISVRRVNSPTRLPPATSAANTATFTGLEGRAYLVAAVFSAVAGTGNTVSLENDTVSPTDTYTVAADRPYAVLIATPLAGTLRLNWSGGLTLASCWAQRYYGGHYGNDR